MYHLKTITALWLCLVTVYLFGQNSILPKLGGLWHTPDSQQIFIDNYSSSGSYLANDTIINYLSVFLFGDTLNFKQIHIGIPDNAIDTIWFNNEFNFQLIAFKDSVMWLKPINTNAKWLFNDLEILKLKNGQFHYDSTLQFNELEYSVSYYADEGSLGTYRIRIDSNKTLYFENTYFPNTSFDDPTDTFYFDRQIIKKGKTTLDSLDYEELLDILSVCHLNDVNYVPVYSISDPNRSEWAIVHFNGTKRQLWSSHSNIEGIKRLFAFLEEFIE